MRVVWVEGVVPRPKADMTEHTVNRTTVGVTTISRTKAWCGWRESNQNEEILALHSDSLPTAH